MTGTDKKPDVAATAAAVRTVPVLLTGLALILLALALGAWIFARLDKPFEVDLWWDDLLGEWSVIIGGFALVMNFLGGGWFGVFVVPAAAAIALVVIRKPWSAVYLLAAQGLSTGIVQLVKQTLGRARPDGMLVISDAGSYPSGHVAEAATLAVAAFMIFPRLSVAIIGAAWVMLMAFSRTYVHAHWLSDTFGGALFGAGAALVAAAIFTRPLSRERNVHRR